MKKMLFSGSVSRITSDGRSATVILDDEIEGTRLAVISPDTIGRRKMGLLKAGTKVKGVGKRGPDAIDALSVEQKK